MSEPANSDVDIFRCADCGGVFECGQSDEDAQAESVATFGVRGDAPGMVLVCDDCYQKILAEMKG